MTYDAVIVGTGPAGLSAALTLGRERRTTLLIDGGPGRNAPSDGVHNFLTRDGIAPDDLGHPRRRRHRPGTAVHPTLTGTQRKGDQTHD